MSGYQDQYPVATMCRLLGVSTSGYYAWRERPLSTRDLEDAALKTAMTEIHRRSRGTYGSPRIHAELKDQGTHVGRKRVARLMRELGLEGSHGRRRRGTIRRDPDAQAAPDRIDRDFSADGPDQLWVGDIKYITMRSGCLHLAVVVDAFSGRVVGWAMAPHLRTELVLQALNIAIGQRRPQGVIHHSDQGSQYTAIAFGRRGREAGVRPSMGSQGDCYDARPCGRECALHELLRHTGAGTTAASHVCGPGRGRAGDL